MCKALLSAGQSGYAWRQGGSWHTPEGAEGTFMSGTQVPCAPCAPVPFHSTLRKAPPFPVGYTSEH